MARKGIKQHRWENLPQRKCFTLYHNDEKIEAFIQCKDCGRYHGISRVARGVRYWTWMYGEAPIRYGQHTKIPVPPCFYRPEQLSLQF